MTDKEKVDWTMNQPKLVVAIEGVSGGCILWPKVFSSGGVGWHCSQKVDINGLRVQMNLIGVVIGSKNAIVESPGSPAKAPGRPQDASEPAKPTQRASKAPRKPQRPLYDV